MNRILSVALFLLVVVNSSLAQVGTSSPYSRFGLGDLLGTVFPEYNALGGGVTAFSNPYSINPYNPATFNSFGPNSFLLSTGGMHKTTNMQNVSESQITNNTSFSHLAIAFPISKKLGASLGMLPYSNIGYELNSRNEEYNADLMYSGDGGISKVYLGGAYQLTDKLSIGANASYLFGGLNRRKKVVYNDESFFNSRSNSKINLQGYYYEVGLLYKKDVSENKELSVGLTVNNNSEIRVKRNELVETFEYAGFFELPKDTFENTTEWGYMTLPQYISAGITYSEGKKLLLVIDYSLQNWAEYRLFDESDNLNNSMRISGGAQYTPEYNSVTKYYKRMQYRLGTTYWNTPLQFDNNQLIEKSISFGIGIPVKRSRTKYNLSVILGERGTTENNLLKEQFIKFGLSVSYDGIWFVKRKYD
ncbi:hypothetical protein OAJ65_00060 [Flavobacteriales bacterium]|nr:hypothetical protein [Flavobacteriales bacterium]